eukprot:GHRR01011113.1.p1 GENE.GHRR01011113.1~~GHRR01011113.1.p1  ORF type:complete len:148 (+),score=34.44 GHRR01011113.1:786-1229(+)
MMQAPCSVTLLTIAVCFVHPSCNTATAYNAHYISHLAAYCAVAADSCQTCTCFPAISLHSVQPLVAPTCAAQMVCAVEELQQPGDFLCGSLADVRYLLVRGQDGQLRAFHNVCRHHAAAVAQGAGNQLLFQCPYHNWTYGECPSLCW